MPGAKFEYRSEVAEVRKIVDTIEPLAEDGWRPIALVPLGGDSDAITILFERPK